MIAILVRLWIFVLMALSAIFALEGFGLLTVSPQIIAILWLILFLSLLVYLVQTSRTPPG